MLYERLFLPDNDIIRITTFRGDGSLISNKDQQRNQLHLFSKIPTNIFTIRNLTITMVGMDTDSIGKLIYNQNGYRNATTKYKCQLN